MARQSALIPVTYEIIFPDGSWYVGSTKRLGNRLASHWSANASPPMWAACQRWGKGKVRIIWVGEQYRAVERSYYLAMLHCRGGQMTLNQKVPARY